MWFEAVLIGICIGLIRGGRLNQLDNLNFKGSLFIVLGLLIQLVPFFLHPISFIKDNAMYFTFSGLLLALLVLILNIKRAGIIFVILGSALQVFVLLMHDLKMPIRLMQESSVKFVQMRLSIEAGEIANYILFSQSDHWSRYFGKLVVLPSYYPFSQAIGLGDVLIALGIIWFIQSEMINFRLFGRAKASTFRRY
jgi:hypothetical protein